MTNLMRDTIMIATPVLKAEELFGENLGAGRFRGARSCTLEPNQEGASRSRRALSRDRRHRPRTHARILADDIVSLGAALDFGPVRLGVLTNRSLSWERGRPRLHPSCGSCPHGRAGWGSMNRDSSPLRSQRPQKSTRGGAGESEFLFHLRSKIAQARSFRSLANAERTNLHARLLGCGRDFRLGRNHGCCVRQHRLNVLAVQGWEGLQKVGFGPSIPEPFKDQLDRKTSSLDDGLANEDLGALFDVILPVHENGALRDMNPSQYRMSGRARSRARNFAPQRTRRAQRPGRRGEANLEMEGQTS